MALRWTIYCHTHTDSGCRYIGLTKLTMAKRWNQHLQNARKKRGRGCSYFWNAIRKYGPSAFSHEVLEICRDLHVANLAEECWIEFYDTRNPENGFNLAKGGASAWTDPRSTRQKLSEAAKNSMTPERRASLSALRKGVPLSEETRAKINVSAKLNSHDIATRNRARGPEHFRMLSAAGRRAITPDVLARISEANRGRLMTSETKLALQRGWEQMGPESRAKMSFKGKKHSLEAREKISESVRRQKRNASGRYEPDSG
jgi:group I intron endonuclease